MKKSRRIRLAAIVWLLSMAGFTLAERATDKELAQQAIDRFLATDDESYRDAQISTLHNEIADRALTAPRDISAATVIFRSGTSVASLERIVTPLDLNVIRIDIKVPMNDQGIVQSLSIGPDELLRRPGSFGEQASRTIAAFRAKFLEWSTVRSGTEAADMQSVALAPMLIYSSEVFGSNHSIEQLVAHRAVALVVPSSPRNTASSIGSYRQFQQIYSTARDRLESTGADTPSN